VYFVFLVYTEFILMQMAYLDFVASVVTNRRAEIGSPIFFGFWE